MTKRRVYHVTPDGKDGWDVQGEGNKNPSDNFERKEDAIQRGKELAKRGQLGQIKIHKKDGTIQTEHTYGKDPRSIPG